MSPILTLGWSWWVFAALAVVFLIVSVMLILTVLIQKPQGGGLAGAFGGAGAGSGQTAFGAKTGDALTVFTIIMFVAYLGFAITLNFAAKGLIKARRAPDTQQVLPASPEGTTPTPPAAPTTGGETPAP
jgi:preprotein translocase subunit SecG